MDFQPMSSEEMQQAMQFVLQQQAQFAADLSSTEARWTTRFDRLVDQTDRLADIVGQLAVAQQRTDEQFRAMQLQSDAQRRATDQRLSELGEYIKSVESHLNIVVTMFERHLREDHGHRPS